MTEILDRNTIKALSVEQRQDIMKMLAKRPYTASEIAKITGKHVTTVAQHLSVLENSGLVRKKDSQNKWVYYTLTDRGERLFKPQYYTWVVVLSLSIVLMSIGMLRIVSPIDYGLMQTTAADAEFEKSMAPLAEEIQPLEEPPALPGEREIAITSIPDSNELGVSQVEVTSDTPDVRVRVRESTSWSDPRASQSDSVYKQIDIEKSVPESEVTSARIDFKVPKTWLDEVDANETEVTLKRFVNGSWDSLETNVEREDEQYVYYSARSPGFSTFAIVAEENKTETKTQESGGLMGATIPVNESPSELEAALAPPATGPDMIAFALIAMGVFGLIYVVYRSKLMTSRFNN